MPSLKTTILAAATLLAPIVRADYYIVPSTVPLSLRDSWCNDEISSCPLICDLISSGKPLTNTCDPTTLTYGCVCSNSMQPNVSQYTLTIPYFTCTEWTNQCVTACGSNNDCSSSCRQDHPCGATDPPKTNTTTTATTASATGSSSTSSATIYNGLAGTSSTPNAAPAFGQMQLGGALSFFMLAAGVTAGFGLVM
ncbi:hypothetical protein BX600DRAFT_430318 [Xylariales sp. PMI_506]|nr:hypothetical protein BX600DRAFT_430318 [Xylariales sp. PMI_506]